MTKPRFLNAARAFVGLATIVLTCSEAAAQYIDQAIVNCSASFDFASKHVALDDPLAIYAEAPVANVPVSTRRIVRFDIASATISTLRTFAPGVRPDFGYALSAVVQTNSAEIYAADADDALPGRYAVYRSLNRGLSWTKVRGNASGCAPILEVSPDGGLVSWKTSCGEAGERSFDRGNTWVAPAITYHSTEQAAFTLADPKTVYRMIWSGGSRSSDGGTTWTTMAMRGYAADLDFVAKADGVDANTLYVITSGNTGHHFQYSRNGGDDWVQVRGAPSFYSLAASPDISGLLYTRGLHPTEFYRSADYGNSWSLLPISPGLLAYCGRTGYFAVGRKSGDAIPLYPETALVVLFDAPRSMPGTGTFFNNTYGTLTVTGGTVAGNTISNLQPDAIIQLGPVAGSAGSFLEIDFDGIDIAAGKTLTIRSGAPGQTVVLFNANAVAGSVAGLLQAEGGNGALPPVIYLHNPAGITVAAGGAISATEGLTVDTLGNTVTTGQTLVNQGTIDGGSSLRLLNAKVNGGGAFKGNAIFLGTFGNANNPVNGAHYLSNSLQLFPSSGTTVALTLNLYGASPQVLNVKVNGDGSVSLPSAWAGGSTSPPNNLPVLLGGSRPPGTPDPAYGGGSMIVQASGALSLAGGTTNNFVFPGGIAIKAGGDLNLNGVTIDNGWTTTGKSFQGVFLESPNIISGGNIQVLTNNLNWVNFSTLPHAPVRTWTLVQMGDGSASYATADGVAPHLNTYSVITEAGANGQCWVCMFNTQPVNMY